MNKKSKPSDKQRPDWLERLSQTQAAELIGMTPRGLRYSTEAPRNHDGTYHGQALVLWMLLRAAQGELPAKWNAV